MAVESRGSLGAWSCKEGRKWMGVDESGERGRSRGWTEEQSLQQVDKGQEGKNEQY